MLQNYEVKSNSFTDNDEVIENANREGSLKINPDDEITSNIIFRAVRDLFGDSVKKANKRVDRSYKRVFLNLSKREKILEESNNETEEEWKKLQGNASAIAKEAGDGEWQVLVSDECLLSFARFENGRCDGRVMVCEVKFIKSNTRKRIETQIIYDHHALKPHIAAAINDRLVESDIVSRAKSVLSLMDKSYVCSGFLASEINYDLELYELNFEKHYIEQLKTSDGTVEERIFSSECEVFTNSAGLTCSRCCKLKKCFKRKEKRNQEKHGIHPRTNHRYMSKDQLVDKVAMEKKKMEEQKRRRERVEAEMIEVVEEDHKDLKFMMANVKTNMIPEDMVLFWEQQQRMFETKSSKGYRWHPR